MTEGSSDVPAGRKGLAIALGVVGTVGPFLLITAYSMGTPFHSNGGGVSGWLLHTGGAAVLGLLLAAVFGGLAALGYKRWPDPRMGTAVMGACVFSLIAGWRVFDAVNVRYDRSPVLVHEVRFVSYSKSNKGPHQTVVSSWKDPGDTETIEVYTKESDRKPGGKVRVVTRAGALGREYVQSVEPAR